MMSTIEPAEPKSDIRQGDLIMNEDGLVALLINTKRTNEMIVMHPGDINNPLYKVGDRLEAASIPGWSKYHGKLTLVQD